MKSRSLLTVLVIAILAVTLTLPITSHAKEPLKKVILCIASTNFPAGAGPYTSVAKYLGYWKEEGLDVEILGAAGSRNAMQTVLGKRADVAIVVPITIYLFRAKGAKVRGFYTVYRHNWFYPVVLKDSPIKDLKDFKGKTIGVQSMGAAMIPFMRAAAAEAGLDPKKDINFVAAGLGAQAAALLMKKRIDILMLWAGQYALMENEGFKFRKFPDIAPLSSLSFTLPFVARDEYIEKNPDIIVGLGRGFAKGTLFSLTNPEAAVKIHWKLYPQSKPPGDNDAIRIKKAIHELVSATEFMRIDNTSIKKWGATSKKEVETYADFLVRTGIMKTKPDAPSTYFTDEFIDRINQFDEKKIVDQAKKYK
jgi:NitT/TauT family transport system substrate-binding protein